MSWLMFILYVVTPMPGKPLYDAVLAKKYYASVEECNAAGKAMIEALQGDEKVAKIIAGTCVPTPAQQVKE